MPAKRAVEIGQIPEAGIERYGTNLLAGTAWIRQQPVRAHKTLRKDILGKGRVLAFKQLLDPAWLDPMPCGDCRH